MAKNKTSILLIGLCTFLPAFGQCAYAATPQTATANVSNNDLGLLESRFFSRQYVNDPVEKRLERLELLMFGQIQGGENADRIAKIKKNIEQRAATPVAPEKITADSSSSDDKTNGTKSDIDKSVGEGKYPQVNTLEWRVLKKTYAQDALDGRLDRLETKLFGQPSSGMAYVDRIDRIKRTLGIEVNIAKQSPSSPTGPKPKARAGGNDIFQTMPDTSMIPGMPEAQDMSPFGMGAPAPVMPMPQMGMNFGFPGFGFGGNTQMTQMFADMNRQMANMNRQMAEMRKLGPGTWFFDSKTGKWIDLNKLQAQQQGQQPAKPGQTPVQPKALQAPPLQPKYLFKNQKFQSGTELPPYADPNSI